MNIINFASEISNAVDETIHFGRYGKEAANGIATWVRRDVQSYQGRRVHRDSVARQKRYNDKVLAPGASRKLKVKRKAYRDDIAEYVRASRETPELRQAIKNRVDRTRRKESN